MCRGTRAVPVAAADSGEAQTVPRLTKRALVISRETCCDSVKNLVQSEFPLRNGMGALLTELTDGVPSIKRYYWFLVLLTRAPLGYFYNAPHWGGAISSPPPLISETTGPILKIQTAFERPGKTVEGKQILLTSGSRVTSQVRSKSKCSTFRAW